MVIQQKKYHSNSLGIHKEFQGNGKRCEAILALSCSSVHESTRRMLNKNEQITRIKPLISENILMSVSSLSKTTWMIQQPIRKMSY